MLHRRQLGGVRRHTPRAPERAHPDRHRTRRGRRGRCQHLREGHLYSDVGDVYPRQRADVSADRSRAAGSAGRDPGAIDLIGVTAMRLHIEHTTTYDYMRPVQLQRHRLVLRPREGHDLRIERMDLHLEPAHRLQWIRDVFGNSIALVDWLEPSAQLTIVNDVVVERVLPFPSRALHEPWRVPFPPRYDALEAAVTGVYVAPSYLEDAPAVQ